MAAWLEFVRETLDSGAGPTSEYERPCVGCFESPRREYEVLDKGPALVDRSYRGLLEIAGADRSSWLHNLTTNHVKTLSSGDGNYAFVLNLQGRILFDLNLMVRADTIWVDLDRRFMDVAMGHFEKYIIMEDVQVHDRSDDWVRFGLVGERSSEILSQLGATNTVNLPFLAMAEAQWHDSTIHLLRHDFCGSFGIEMFVPAEHSVECWKSLTDKKRTVRAISVGDDAVQVRRIESGIPWSGHEITDEYLPAETGLLEQAVSFNKGCYLGQEVVERMRSRQVVARRLVGQVLEGEDCPSTPADLLDADGKVIGKLTSVCHSAMKAGPIGMGYVKTASSDIGTRLGVTFDGGEAKGVVVDLPFSP